MNKGNECARGNLAFGLPGSGFRAQGESGVGEPALEEVSVDEIIHLIARERHGETSSVASSSGEAY